jgi:hypothetical protein
LTKLVAALAFAVVVASAPAAFAKKKNHHCEIDGKEVVKTHKACKAAKGKWVKGAPTAAAQ